MRYLRDNYLLRILDKYTIYIVIVFFSIACSYNVISIFERESNLSGEVYEQYIGDDIFLVDGTYTDSFTVHGNVEKIEIILNSDTKDEAEIMLSQAGNKIIKNEIIEGITVITFDVNFVKDIPIDFFLNCKENSVSIKKGLYNYFGTQMLLNVKYSIPNVYNLNQFVFIMIMILCLMSNVVFLQKKNTRMLFLSTSLYGFIALIMRFPYYICGYGAYYEVPQLYFATMLHYDWKSLFFSDAGYWPLAQRLFVFILYKMTKNISTTVFLSNLCIYIFISIIFSKLVKKSFSTLCIEIKYLIVLLFLSSGILIRSDQMLSILNVTYFMFVLVFLYSIEDMEKMNIGEYVIAIISGILLISKALLISLLPGLLILVVDSKAHKKKKKMVWALMNMTCLSMQIIYIFINSMNEIKTNDCRSCIIKIAVGVRNYFVIIFDAICNNQFCLFLKILILCIVITGFILNFRLLSDELKIGVIIIIVSAFVTSEMDAFSRNIISLGLDEKYKFNFEWFSKNAFNMIFLSNIFVLFCLIFAYYQINCNRVIKGFMLLSFFVFLLFFYPCEYENHKIGNDYGLAAWGNSNETYYCVPTNVAGLYGRKGDYSLVGYGNLENSTMIMNESMSYSTLDFYNVVTDKSTISDISVDDVFVMNIYAKKINICQKNNIYAVCYDKNGDEIKKIQAIISSIPNKGIVFEVNESCSLIRFVDENDMLIDLSPVIIIQQKWEDK